MVAGVGGGVVVVEDVVVVVVVVEVVGGIGICIGGGTEVEVVEVVDGRVVFDAMGTHALPLKPDTYICPTGQEFGIVTHR